MLSKLGVGEDLFAELQPISVLFVLVTSLSKEAKFGGQLAINKILREKVEM